MVLWSCALACLLCLQPHKSGLNLAIEQVVKKLTSLSGSPKRGSNQDVPNVSTYSVCECGYCVIVCHWDMRGFIAATFVG